MIAQIPPVLIVAAPILVAVALFGVGLSRAAALSDALLPCPECSGTEHRHEPWCEYGEASLFTPAAPPAIQAGGGFRAIDADRRTRQRLHESTAAMNTRPVGGCDTVLPLHPRSGPSLHLVSDTDAQESR